MAQMAATTREEIEEQVRNIQAKKKNLTAPEETGTNRVGFGDGGHFDTDIYGARGSKFEGYVTSIASTEDVDDDDDLSTTMPKKSTFTAPLNLLNDTLNEKDYDPLAEHRQPRPAEREDDYRARRRNLIISPARYDPFADGGKTPDPGDRTYLQVMVGAQLAKDERNLRGQMVEKAKAGDLRVVNGTTHSGESSAQKQSEKKKRRWDISAEDTPSKKSKSTWDAAESGTPSSTRWDETPGRSKGGETPGATPTASTRQWDTTPGHATPGAATPGRESTPGHQTTPSARKNRWDETPKTERETPGHATPGHTTPGHGGWAETPRTDRGGDLIQDTPTPGASKRRSRWDETPGATPGNMTPGGMTPSMATPGGTTPGNQTPNGVTPTGQKAMAMATPTPGHLMSMTPEQLQAYTWQREIDERNRPLADEELDTMFPPGYKVLQPPAGYIPIRTPARKLIATPTPMAGTPTGFRMQTPDSKTHIVDMQPKGNLPMMKPDDMQYFDKLLVEVDEETLSPEEQKERKIMKLLLKIKNGTPPMRKAALRQITDKAREFGAGPLFNQILPLLMSPTLEDQERHLLVKVIDRILYKLDDLVRPYVHKILVVIEPLLIDEDYYARVEGREIISNLAKAAGLATMISTMRPDIDNMDEYVRNTTARAFAVVASALGIPSLLPFLKAVCKSKKSWQARHTGIKIVQQIAILMGCAILPHLKSLVEIIEHGLVDEQQKVRTITALALAALAEAATPYGIESFDSVLKPLWKGIRLHRGKGLAAF
ncbi:hypothetical protein ScPMuIL_016412 [Solemya velum]